MPLFREPRTSLDVDLLAETELDRLLNRKSVIYRNLRDLEFDYSMGRLSEDDFRRLEADHKHDAVNILAKLDQLGASDGLDEAIAKDIASRKSKLFESGAARVKESPRCPACGADIIAGKKFCADCGQRL
jgi:predicted Zn-ribbon and HTH transcriptional regulator